MVPTLEILFRKFIKISTYVLHKVQNDYLTGMSKSRISEIKLRKMLHLNLNVNFSFLNFENFLITTHIFALHTRVMSKGTGTIFSRTERRFFLPTLRVTKPLSV